MRYFNKVFILLFILLLSLGCSKEEEKVNPYVPGSYSTVNTGNTGGSNSNNCTTIVALGTITHNGITYKINALSGSSNTVVGVEWVNLSGDPFPAN